MILMDVQRIETLMTIIVLSSLLSAVMVFFAVWFLSRWVEVKELTLKLLKRIDENYVEQKSEKLKAIYVKQAFNDEATLNYEEPQTTNPEVTTTAELKIPVFEEDITTTTETTTTKKPATTNDIKEILRKRKGDK